MWEGLSEQLLKSNWFCCCGPQTLKRSKQFVCVAGGEEESRSRVITAPCVCALLMVKLHS